MRIAVCLALVAGCGMASSAELAERHRKMPQPTVSPEAMARRQAAEQEAAKQDAAESAETRAKAAAVARAMLLGLKTFADTRQRSAQQQQELRCVPDPTSPYPGAVKCKPAP